MECRHGEDLFTQPPLCQPGETAVSRRETTASGNFIRHRHHRQNHHVQRGPEAVPFGKLLEKA